MIYVARSSWVGPVLHRSYTTCCNAILRSAVDNLSDISVDNLERDLSILWELKQDIYTPDGRG